MPHPCPPYGRMNHLCNDKLQTLTNLWLGNEIPALLHNLQWRRLPLQRRMAHTWSESDASVSDLLTWNVGKSWKKKHPINNKVNIWLTSYCGQNDCLSATNCLYPPPPSIVAISSCRLSIPFDFPWCVIIFLSQKTNHFALPVPAERRFSPTQFSNHLLLFYQQLFHSRLVFKDWLIGLAPRLNKSNFLACRIAESTSLSLAVAIQIKGWRLCLHHVLHSIWWQSIEANILATVLEYLRDEISSYAGYRFP